MGVCWWVGNVGSDVDASYSPSVALSVTGPTPVQSFSGVVNAGAGSILRVVGTNLNSLNRLRIIDSSGTCGSSTASSSLATAPGVPSASSATALAHSGVKLSSVASYKVCWWNGVARTRLLPMEWTPALSPLQVAITGAGQETTNRMMFPTSDGTCGSSSQATPVTSVGTPSGSAAAMAYSDINVQPCAHHR